MTDKKDLIKVESQDSSWDEALKTESWIAPDVNIYDTDEHYFIVANMPGVERTNIKVKLENGYLILMGRVHSPKMDNNSYILNETKIGNFYRKFKISENVDESKIEAKYENGQMHLALAKSDRMKTRMIDID